jgi:hypothetical protein
VLFDSLLLPVKDFPASFFNCPAKSLSTFFEAISKQELQQEILANMIPNRLLFCILVSAAFVHFVVAAEPEMVWISSKTVSATGKNAI